MDEIPTIDLSPFLLGEAEEECKEFKIDEAKRRCAVELGRCFERFGFCYVENVGIEGGHRVRLSRGEAVLRRAVERTQRKRARAVGTDDEHGVREVPSGSAERPRCQTRRKRST